MTEMKSGAANIGLMLLLSALSILLLFSNLWQHWSLSIAALIYFALFSFYILRVFPAAFVLLMFFIIMRFTTILSGVAIESGGNMHEILTMGEATGTSIRLAAVYTIGILWAAIMASIGIKRISHIKHETTITSPSFQLAWMSAVFALIALFCAVAAWIGIQNGFPLITGEDRIGYWRSVDNRFLYFFLGNRFIFALLLGLIFSLANGWKQKTSIALTIAIFCISFLFAEKFTSIITMMVAFITPVFLRNPTYLENLSKRLIPIGALAVCLTVPVILIVYGVFDNPQNAAQKLQSRATSQSQVWYITDRNQDKYLNFDTPRITHNLKALTTLDGTAVANTAPYLGVKDIMFHTMEEKRYAHYVKNGITFTMGTEGYLLKLFGRIGMIVPYLFLLSIYVAHLLYLYYAIQSADPVRVILIAKVLVWSNFALNQGYFWFLLGAKSLVLIAIIVLYELVMRASFSKGKKGAKHAP